jgi:ubiquinone/menaquinone biosynthesis C-methylase UbiE
MGSSSKPFTQLAAPSDAELDPLDQLLEHSILELSAIGLEPDPMTARGKASLRSERSEPHSGSHAQPNLDPFANINACSTDHIDRLADILEIRGARPRQTRMRGECFSAAGLSPGMSVLEIGCGTGVVARELASIAGRTGRVVGLDVSPALLGYARRRTAPEDVPVEYLLGDAYNLDFPNRCFDASCSFTLLAHLNDLDRAVREMIRVTGHTVMLFDQDYQTLVFENSDTALTRKILQHGADHNVVDGWCGRKLPGVLVRHGLRDVQCCPFVYCERDSQSYLITIAERFVTLAARHGVVTEAEKTVWLQELHDRAIEGTFFASLNYYFAFGTREPSCGARAQQ